jgi:hypothetical protein
MNACRLKRGSVIVERQCSVEMCNSFTTPRLDHNLAIKETCERTVPHVFKIDFTHKVVECGDN